ncbi:MAG: hypothetical protein N0C84_01000 [Candidatus Thiodiazotropha taylori]|uniref:Uncharacterized protein n=1 Tax=Candidatus Thiodiazotropha taylori TaxID=2792791 RepID=A0A9E4N2K9_9GAMM|nr:hypothetical protein [Candidatus Thiodiazotropha taylori]MCW4255023.1 hypothetical protein [Candidatus Thiodiazotropha taylori]
MVGYRFYGSPRDYFTAPVKKISSRAYQTPRMVKGQTPYVVSGIVTEFISKNLKQEQLSGLRIRDVADILIQQCIDATNNDIMFVFHCNEIAKDLSCIYPDLISPLSECYVGRGAVYGLEAMKGKLPSSIPLRGKGTIKWTNDNAHTIRELQFGDWSFCDIEHALCEYGKYRRVVVTGKGAKKRPPKNISYDLFGNLIVDK